MGLSFALAASNPREHRLAVEKGLCCRRARQKRSGRLRSKGGSEENLKTPARLLALPER